MLSKTHRNWIFGLFGIRISNFRIGFRIECDTVFNFRWKKNLKKELKQNKTEKMFDFVSFLILAVFWLCVFVRFRRGDQKSISKSIPNSTKCLKFKSTYSITKMSILPTNNMTQRAWRAETEARSG